VAITDRASFLAAYKSAQWYHVGISSLGVTAGLRQRSLWGAYNWPLASAMAVGDTTNGVIPTNSSPNAVPFKSFGGSNTGYLLGMRAACSQEGTLVLYDRLWHYGARAFSTTSAGITQPSLTRALGYLDVELWAEVVTTGTLSVLTATVTDDKGTSGRTVTLTGAPANSIGAMMRFGVTSTGQQGCAGIQSVQSIIASGNGTATYNLFLMRRIHQMHIRPGGHECNRNDHHQTRCAPIQPNSCLAMYFFPLSATASTFNAQLLIGEA
jgi:hypothetical protein